MTRPLDEEVPRLLARIGIMAAVVLVPVTVMLVLFGVVLFAAAPMLLGDGDNTTDWGGSALAADSVPQPYEPAIIRAGHRCATVSPALIAAQLGHESDFDPRAVNPSTGARGIAQFLPSTWQQWGTDYDADGVARPTDPDDAIGSQADYLCAIAEQMKGWLQAGRVHGDLVELTLAGYNAGPANVLAAGGVPAIPETVDYVRSITAAMARYSGGVPAGGAVPGSTVGKVIATAQAELGKPYVFGSVGPDSWDCSSLVEHAWRSAGVEITRTTYSQVASPLLREVSYSQRRPGDLIYFKMNGAAGSFDHVGLVFDDRTMIEAPRTGLTVRYQVYEDSYYRARSPMIMRVVTS